MTFVKIRQPVGLDAGICGQKLLLDGAFRKIEILQEVPNTPFWSLC